MHKSQCFRLADRATCKQVQRQVRGATAHVRNNGVHTQRLHAKLGDRAPCKQVPRLPHVSKQRNRSARHRGVAQSNNTAATDTACKQDSTCPLQAARGSILTSSCILQLESWVEECTGNGNSMNRASRIPKLGSKVGWVPCACKQHRGTGAELAKLTGLLYTHWYDCRKLWTGISPIEHVLRPLLHTTRNSQQGWPRLVPWWCAGDVLARTPTAGKKTAQ